MAFYKNITIEGAEKRPLLLDIFPSTDRNEAPLIVFAHGFKGFKDWGHWPLVAQRFAEAGMHFLKFNFSHNGVTTEKPTDFDDLEAFGRNTYSKEHADFHAIKHFIESRDFPVRFDPDKICVIGHSRGGAMSIIQACRTDFYSACVTWASVDRLDYSWNDSKRIDIWKSTGVSHILNGRTGQQMPLYYSLYEDFKAHESYFNVSEALQTSRRPFCFIHGKKDPAVPYSAALGLHKMALDSELHFIDDADHVFNGRHPFPNASLPSQSETLVKITSDFLTKTWKI